VSRTDRRLVIGAACGIALALAASQLSGLQVEPKGTLAQWSQTLASTVGPHLWHWVRSTSRKDWATIVQLVGAVVTFGGLWTAWLRAKHGETIRSLGKRLAKRIAERVVRILGIPRGVVIPVEAASAIAIGSTAFFTLTFGIDRTKSTVENFERLVDFVNRLSGNTILQIEQQIDELRRDIKDARAHASDLASRTLAHLEQRIDYVQKELDTKQVLDLRWAIYGLLITVIGIGMSYGT
jgi:hypothetical protein